MQLLTVYCLSSQLFYAAVYEAPVSRTAQDRPRVLRLEVRCNSVHLRVSSSALRTLGTLSEDSPHAERM